MSSEAMFQAGEEPLGSRCQLSGQVVIDISGDSGHGGVVNDPRQVNAGRLGYQVQGNVFVTKKKNLGVNEVEADQGGEQLDDIRNDSKLDGSDATLWQHQIFKTVIEGNWEATRQIYEKHNLDINAPIDETGRTILHYAARTLHVDYTMRLVSEMNDEGLNRSNTSQETALCVAGSGGLMAVAEHIVKRLALEDNPRIRLRCPTDTLNYSILASIAYEVLEKRLHVQDIADLFGALIDGGDYECALDMMNKHSERLVTYKDMTGGTALHRVAKNPGFLTSTNSFRRRFFKLFAGVLTCEKVQKNTLYQSARACKLVVKMCKKLAKLDHRKIENLIGHGWDPLFIAADKGNVEFLKIFIRAFPAALYKINNDGQTIFHIAVLNRHEKIFTMIHETGPLKINVRWEPDKDGNLLSHLAGKLAPSSQLNVVPGAALQLQRELIWFQEVNKEVIPAQAEHKNHFGKTALDEFMDNHRDLIKNGEKWMRNTANSCLIVATLVATVVFAAAFTAPGGYNQTTGFPVFLTTASFQIFLVADAISLIFSVLSILTFLSVLTSTYQLEDFVQSLPARLLFGLTTLFVSITAMMVAFVTVFFVYFTHHHRLAYAIPVAVLASVPICWFIWSHARLFVNVMRSVLNSSFRPNYKDPLFPAPKKNKSV